MGFLIFAGLIGTLAYGTHFAKNEKRAIKSDLTIRPTNTQTKDKRIIEKNFELICKRCNIKLDNDGSPILKDGYNPCVAYLQYQGFQETTSNYFKELYLQKYYNKQKNDIKNIKYKHNNLLFTYYDSQEKDTKIYRHWGYGDTKEKCKQLMNNILWRTLVKHYNVVKDGSQNVEVWSIYAPPLILNQIDEIYEEVCLLETNRGD